jgi:hypothetical protein
MKLVAISVLSILVLSTCVVAQVQLPWDEALAKAQVDGKYRMLLKQIRVPEDAATYGEFHDYGAWSGTSWAGYSDLPEGHWVYVYPCWYIWAELSATPVRKRPWGPEQAVGAPDSKGPATDSSWIAASRDRPEWILVEFDKLLQVTEIILQDASECPVSFKLNGITAAGSIGSKMDGLSSNGGPSIIRKPFAPPWKLQRLRIDIESGHQGWKGLDAVGVVDDAGVIHWARAAQASSWRGQEPVAASPEIWLPPLVPPWGKIEALEAEIAALKAEIERLKKELAQKK